MVLLFTYAINKEQIKEIIKSFGGKYKIIPKQCFPSCVDIDKGTMLILPQHKPAIKIWSDELSYED